MTHKFLVGTIGLQIFLCFDQNVWAGTPPWAKVIWLAERPSEPDICIDAPIDNAYDSTSYTSGPTDTDEDEEEITAEDYFTCALDADRNKDYPLALHYLEWSAALGHPRAQRLLSERETIHALLQLANPK